MGMRQFYHFRRLLPVFAVTLMVPGCAAWTQLAAGPVDRLQELVGTRLRDPRLAGCHVGLAVYSLDRREWLCEFDADRRFVPASNVKLVTAATALQTFGTGYRSRTDV